MTLNYDLDAGALYIRLRDGEAARTRELDDNTNVDLDAAGNVLGVEIVSARHMWAILEVLQMDGISTQDKRAMQAYFMAATMPEMSVAS